MDTANINTFVRVNGRGNAWPIYLGSTSNFYDNSSLDLANASYSLLGCNKSKFSQSCIEWEVLIDAGHHTAPFLIQNGNRIPEAVVLTHGHMDHTLGLDWVAQSKYRLSNRKHKLAVYASLPVWQFVIQSFPHLKSIINFKELLPGEKVPIDEVDKLNVTAFPVFHGESAKGASMLFFETPNNKSVLFTGDMLCPLLRKADYDAIKSSSYVFIDTNNRYPYPDSNHGSIVASTPTKTSISPYLEEWYSKAALNYLLSPHQLNHYNKIHCEYFEEYLTDFKHVSELPHTVLEFAQKSKIKQICLIHFGGMEDEKYYNHNCPTTNELQKWTTEKFKKAEINARIHVPFTGDVYQL